MHGTVEKPAQSAAPAWFPDWSGQVCAVIGSGESATIEAVDALRGRCRTIVVNTTYQRAPWADVLYAADDKWWDKTLEALAFAGLKIAPSLAIAKRHKIARVELVDQADRVRLNTITVERLGVIGRGGNGGFQALNLAVQFGAKRIVLLGLDFCGEHWHGKHPDGLKNARPDTLKRWAVIMDAQAGVLTAMGVEVVNASEVSLLTAFPKMSVLDAMKRFGVTA